MKRFFATIACMAAFVCAVPAYSAALGHAVFVKSVNGNPSKPEVVDRDLDKGSQTVYIGSGILQKPFNASIGEISISPDGRYTALSQGFMYVNFSKPAGLWVWGRKGQKLSSVTRNGSTYMGVWSPSGRYFLALEASGAPQGVYNAVSGKYTAYAGTQSLTTAAVTSDGRGVILVSSRGKESEVFLQRFGSNSRRHIFRWPGAIRAIAQSPDGLRYAISDSVSRYSGNRYFIVDSKGKILSKLLITVEDSDVLTVSLSYSPTGELAVLTSNNYGEPQQHLAQTLWVVNPKSYSVKKVASWNEDQINIGNGSTYTRRKIAGWLPSGKGIILSAKTIWDINQSDWQKLFLVDTTAENGAEKLIFDAGKGTTAIAWYLEEKY